MSEVVITYENLYELLRREKYRAELQKLEPTFFQDVLGYLKDKQAILGSQEKKDSIFASAEVDKTRTQMRNIQRILKELYEKREGKIVQLALFNSRSNIESADLNAMLEEEKELFKSIREALDGFREGVLFKLFNTELPEVSKPDSAPKQKDLKRNSENEGSSSEEQKDLKRNSENEGSSSEESDTRKVRFKCNIPEFVGSDLNTYGPFSENDTANLPQEVVSFLERNNQIEVV
jgi:DNA replication initiation complex subunit (GINS family)